MKRLILLLALIPTLINAQIFDNRGSSLFLLTRNTVQEYNPPTPVPVATLSITTTGTTFAPILTVEAGATILWTFSDASTSSSATPNKNFGSSATRVNSLRVTPASALIEVNFGYGAEDEGSDSIATLAQQNVSAVSGLSSATNLKGFYASGCPLTGQDFSDCDELLDIELYGCSSITSVTLAGATSLRRLCIENNAITGTLNLSTNLLLEDLRAASNQLDSITWGTGTFDSIWHICIRDNTTMDRNLPRLTKFPNIEQLWIWNSGQMGTLDCRGIDPTSLLAYDNAYTAANFQGCGLGSVNISGNNISSINVTSLSEVAGFDASDNSLNEAAVDGVLNALRSYAGGGYTLDLSGNVPPSATGLTYVDELEAGNWVVVVDATASTSWEDTFNRANGAPGNNWTAVSSATAEISTNRLHRTDAGGYRGYYNNTDVTLPANYSVTYTIPEETATYIAFFGVMARYSAGDAVTLFWSSSDREVFVACPYGYGATPYSVTVTGGFPASWAADQNHTIKLAFVGTTCTISFDGQEYGYFTSAVNNTTGTGVGCQGDGNGGTGHFYLDNVLVEY